MFGQHHDDNSQSDHNMAAANITADGTLGIPALGGATEDAAASSDNSSGAPSLSQSFHQPSSATPIQSSTPAVSTFADEPPTVPMSVSSTPSSDDMPPPSGDLVGIKQAALQQLKPLVGHLDQTPEEKFRTTMMMIQAADDQSLLSDAYEAAKAITDEKARAQALLDVVNEINYFTAQNPQSS